VAVGDREWGRDVGRVRRLLGVSAWRVVAVLFGVLGGLALVGAMALGGSPRGARASGTGVVVPRTRLVGPEASRGLLARRSRGEALRRARRLNSSAARRARRRSRTAYRHLNASQALALAEKRFPGVVASPAFNAAHPSPGMTMTRMLSPMSEQVRETRPAIGRSQARIARRDGGMGSDRRMVLMMSGMPLAVMDNGELAPMDLSLSDTGGDFRPKRAMTPVRIGKHAGDGVSFDRGGFSVRMEGSGGTAGKLTPAGAFFAGVGTDTDMQVNAAPHGIESFLQLRSPASPERFVLDFTLPPGGRLVPGVSVHPIPNDPPRSIEIQKADGTPAGYVYPPSTTDADGNSVPSTAHIEGSRVVLQVSHHGRDLHYPLNFDPTIVEYGNSQIGFPGIRWTQAVAPGDSYFGQATDDCGYYCYGLYESLPTNSYFGNNDYAEYYYNTPPNAYVSGNAIYSWSHNTYAYGVTYAFTGLLYPYANANGGPSAWQAGSSGFTLQNPPGKVSDAFPFVAQYAFPAGTVFDCFNPRCDGTQGADYGTEVIGLGAYTASGPGVFTGPNRAYVTADGVGTYLSDRHPPTFTTPTPPSPFWTNDGGQGHTIYVGEADQGLGIMSLTLSNAAGGNGTIMQRCNGAPASSPCPLGPITDSFTYTLNEGITQLQLSLSDIAFNSAQQYWTELIDRTPPVSHLNVPPFVRQSPTLAGDASDPPAPGANGSSGIGATTVQILPPGSSLPS